MDIHHHQKLISSSWEPSMSMSMENHVIHEPINPMEAFWPNFVGLGNHQNPSSSTCQIPDGSGHVRREQIVNQHQQRMVGEDQEDEEEEDQEEEAEEELGAMKEMMFKIAAMQPVDIDPATIRKPKRRNVRISDDPQSVAARHRRERISEKIRILQRLVPGGTKMDTASMLDEAIRYVKFLKRQIRQLQANQQPSLAAPPSSTWTLTKGNLSSTTIATTVTTTTTATVAAASSYGVGANRLCCSDQPICFSNEVIRD